MIEQIEQKDAVKNFSINNLRIEKNKLTADEFIYLRKFGPFIEYRKEDVEAALKTSLFTVALYDEDILVGIARIVGDGKIVFFIKDVAVNPLYKGKKIGVLIMKELFKFIESHACINAYIALMATPNTEGFYEKFGFIRRPNELHGAGMVMYYKGGKIYEENSSVR
ncbi:MAG: GNAT family N-acetyltransferase [Bacilli bacterium]|nr:GNAT family N-acetyltransferase [Bacilli bacterium]